MPDAAPVRHASRGRAWSAWFALVLVVGTILATVGGPAVGRGVLHASDTLQTQAPWKADAPHDFTPQNTSTSDTVDATVPVRVEWSRRARDGDLPLWSDLQAGGAPLASLPNASALSPLSVAWYLVPAWYAPAATKLLEMAVAALFTFLLARRLGAGRAAAGIAAVAFAGSGFQVVWTNWPHTHVAALVPALLWAVDRAQTRGRPVDLVPIALVSASMWFEGFPAITLWAHLAAGVFALVRALPPRIRPGNVATRARNGGRRLGPGRALLVPLGGVVLGAMLAAVQLLPFAFRLGELDLAYRAEKVGVLPWRMIATMVVPDAFGNPAEKVFYGFRNYVEINAFAGATVVVLALTGLVLGSASRVPRWARWFLAAAIAVCIALIFVGGPPLAAFQRIPVVGPNSIGRLRSLLALFVAVQAGVGVDALVRGGVPYRRVVLLGVTLATVGVGVAVLLGSVAATAEAAGHRDYFGQQLVLPALAGAAAVLLVLAATAIRRAGGRGVVVALLGLLVAVESVTFAHAFLPRIDRELFYPATPTHAFLAAELGPDRFAADDFTMVPGSTLVYGLRSATAHTLTPPAYADLLQAIDPEVFARNRTYPVLRPSPALPSSPVLDRMGVTYLVADPATPVAGDVEVVAPAIGQERVDAGGSLAAEVPAGALRAVRLDLREPIDPTGVTEVVVDVVSADGVVRATGRRRVLQRTAAGPFDVAFDAPPVVATPGPWTVRARVEAASGGLVFGVSAPGTLAVKLVRPVDDGLRVAFTDGSVVYARDRALPRFRWAGRAIVEPDPDRRVRLLADGGTPADTVVLSDAPADGTLGGGPAATIEVLAAGGDELAVRVDAARAGYLVVADTIQDGWVATVDGAPATLVDADHAFVAVAVPDGEHRVELRYVPRGWATGLALSAVAALVLVVAALSGSRRRRSGPAR